MKEISVKELKELIDSKADIQLIDVREQHEYEICKINEAELIPMNTVPSNLDKISKDKQVILHCRMGGRSGQLVQWLEQNGIDNAYNLTGGILAWADEIDTSMEKY